MTIAVLLLTQIQFLATLSLVDSTGAEDSLLSELTKNLRSGTRKQNHVLRGASVISLRVVREKTKNVVESIHTCTVKPKSDVPIKFPTLSARGCR